MAVRCPECGFENRPQYRFCGRCGASLPPEASGSEKENTAPAQPEKLAPRAEKIAPPPERIAPRQENPPRQYIPPRKEKNTPLSGPSFLGLGLDKEPEHEASYLLEDEPEHPHGHGRMYVALVLLLIAGALLVWRWKQDSSLWTSLWAHFSGGQSTAQKSSPSTPANPPTPVDAQAPATSSAPLASEGTETASATTPPQAPAGNQPAASGESVPPAASGTEPPPRTGNASDSPVPDKSAPAIAQPEVTTPGSAVTAQPVKPPAPAVVKPAKPAESRKPSGGAKSAADSGDEALAVQGERYLYGSAGVAQNCRLAQNSLFRAAAHSNAHALTVLGTMYATGHCVTRDLPTAYRWLAKALHQDPNNERISRDLEMIWKQMTPPEKQAALRSE